MSTLVTEVTHTVRGKGDNRGVSHTNPESEFEALLHLAERVCLHFPEVSEAEVFALIADELEPFDRARMRHYVPMLVENNVLRRLRAARDQAA